MEFKPFQQIEFENLPQKPSRPHKYFETESHDQRIETKSFGDIEIHYRKIGEGPPLLLIHGLMTSSYSWRYLLSPLSQHYTLYIPDLPGAGKSEKVIDYSYKAENLAKWVHEYQQAMGIEGCPIIGNSMGGYIAMHLALLRPEAMSQLINIHSPAFLTLKMRLLHWALRPRLVRKLLARFVQKSPERWAHKNVHYYDESVKSLEEAQEYGRPLAEAQGARTFISYLYETLGPGSFSHLTQGLKQAHQSDVDFPVPLLLIYARTDPMVPPRIGRKLFRLIPKAKLLWLEDSSHFAHIDSTDELVEPILEFLQPKGL